MKPGDIQRVSFRDGKWHLFARAQYFPTWQPSCLEETAEQMRTSGKNASTYAPASCQLRTADLYGCVYCLSRKSIIYVGVVAVGTWGAPVASAPWIIPIMHTYIHYIHIACILPISIRAWFEHSFTSRNLRFIRHSSLI